MSGKDIPYFFKHMLERIDWTRDLHFQTKTTIDTLDYSGSGWNAGSKVVIACRGEKKRTLENLLPDNLNLHSSITQAKVSLPGILCIQGELFTTQDQATKELQELASSLSSHNLKGFPLIILCDDAEFTAANLNNFVWVTFTRANPSHDVYGVESFIEHKHWGCKGSLIIDARIKPHHAPILKTDPDIDAKVNDIILSEESLKKLGI